MSENTYLVLGLELGNTKIQLEKDGLKDNNNYILTEPSKFCLLVKLHIGNAETPFFNGEGLMSVRIVGLRLKFNTKDKKNSPIHIVTLKYI